MSVRSIEVLQRYLRRLCDEALPPEDGVLLNRFATARDREAFELLIARHGPMVLGTARRLVDNIHDAEDVFQAVFLSLARLAKTIREGRALPAWLHRTTCRIAAKVRKDRVSGSRRETPPELCENIAPDARLIWQEVRQALDEELQHLPERLRSPLLLCYLSGVTRDEAARQLGWSLGTLKRRLEEGRKTLRIRLARRGIASIGLALAVLSPEALQAAVSKSLLDSSLGHIFREAAVPAAISTLVLSSATTTKGVAVKSILAFIAVIALGVGIYAAAGPANPPEKVEGQKEEVKPAPEDKVVQLEDPLPAGSTLRFGTTRFRYGSRVKTLAVSPDGKMAFVSNDLPCIFDLATGRVLYSLNWGGVVVGKFSPDGRTLVFKQGPDLFVRDAATGNEIRTIKGPRTDSWSDEWLEFTPDGKAIAVASYADLQPRTARIHLIDFESGKTIRDFSTDSAASIQGIAFSADGKLMASGGYENEKDDYFARLWDVETGKELRRFMHGKSGYGIRSLAFSPDGKTLATLGTQAGVFLRLFEVDTGKLRRAFPKDAGVRPDRGSVAFSPDGKTVAAASTSIRVYDMTTGEERLRIDRRASDLHFTDGGKTLTAAVSGAIYRWDTATGKTQTPEAADSIVEQILATADGTRVVTRGQDGEAHIWDGASGKHLRRFEAGWQRGMAMSPDGRFLAWPVADEEMKFPDPQFPKRSTHYGSRIRLYDIAADKFVDRFPGFKGDTQDLAFTKDGKLLVTADQHAGMVRIWNFVEGKEERSFQVVTDALKKQSFRIWRAYLSPDGRTVAVDYVHEGEGLVSGRAGPPHLVRLWDVATGKELPELSAGYPIDRAFSPDGRWVVTHGGNFVHEIASGKRVAALPDEAYIQAAAFSGDGRFLATAVSEGVIQIWEVATWTKRNEFKGHPNRVTTLTFAPGGQLLSGYVNTTVVAWDLRPPGPAVKVSLDAAWTELGNAAAGEAFKAEGTFLAAPLEAVKFFAARTKPAQALDVKRVQRLLAELDSAKFTERDAASRALGELGQQVKPYLEEAIETAKSAEVRDRAQKILQGLQADLTPLRQMRAVLVLEQIGDEASKNLLKTWAGGPGGALLTLEAAAALERLETLSKAKR